MEKLAKNLPHENFLLYGNFKGILSIWIWDLFSPCMKEPRYELPFGRLIGSNIFNYSAVAMRVVSGFEYQVSGAIVS